MWNCPKLKKKIFETIERITWLELLWKFLSGFYKYLKKYFWDHLRPHPFRARQMTQIICQILF